MKKILFIAYVFPPNPYGGTFRALRLCRGFSEQDIECHVVTIKEYPDIPNDHGLLAGIPESIRIYRTPILDPWRRYQPYKKRFAGKVWFRFANKIISLMLRPLTFPDHMLFWVPVAVFKSRQLIKQHDIDTVLVSSPPDSSQLIGWILRKTCKIQWIADFRDPIYGNVAQVNMANPSGLIDRLQRFTLEKYDRMIATAANVIIANTETHARELTIKYGCTDVHVIRNSFDPGDFSHISDAQADVLTIAHVGSVYGKRNPDLLFAAVSQLAKECKPEKLRLKLVFLGLGSDSLQESIIRYDVANYVEVRGQAPHDEALRTMCRSHLLLLIKATGNWSRGQIPGKFYEYVGSRKPILCIGPLDSEVADLIRDHKLGYVVEDSLEEMLVLLRTLYRTFSSEGALPPLHDKQLEPFSSGVMVEKMCSVIGAM